MPPAPLLRVAPPGGDAIFSPAQKQFNALILKIDARKKRLVAWQDAVDLFRQRYGRDIEPLVKELDALKAGLARFLDHRVDAKGLSEMDRDAMRRVIRELAAQLLDGPGGDGMKALYARNGALGPDAERRPAQKRPKDAADDDPGPGAADGEWTESPEEIICRLEADMLEQQARREAERQAGKARHRARRKPTARQAAEQVEADGASRSLRDVFRKLASCLHPDRATDATERERKTGLMQRVNQAYAKKDLLAMLQLQLEAEQIDQASIDAMAEDRLRHFNQVLEEQWRRLGEEIVEVEQSFRREFGIDPSARLMPPALAKLLRAHAQQLQDDIHLLIRLPRLLDDTRTLKRWLREQRASDGAQEAFQDALRDLF